MSRVEKFGGSKGKLQQDKAAVPPDIETDTNAEAPLPPRRKKFPSSAQKINKVYYNLLFVLFVILVAGLFWYGTKYSE